MSLIASPSLLLLWDGGDHFVLADSVTHAEESRRLRDAAVRYGVETTHRERGRERRESDRRHDVVHWAASRHRQRDPESDRETVHVQNVLPVQSRREETISGERERAECDV